MSTPSDLVGKVQSVTGLLDPSSLGQTLPHEHCFINFDVAYCNPPSKEDEEIAEILKNELPTLETLGWIRYFPYSHRPNLHLNDLTLAIHELKLLHKSGGKTLVDCTTTGIRTCCHPSPLNHAAPAPESNNETVRNPDALKLISLASGVNVIAGAGYYVAASHPKEIQTMTEEQIADSIVKEIMVGMDGSTMGVRAGIIGEIGTSWPITENEKKVLRGAALAQQRTGAPLIIHPGRYELAPKAIMEILKSANANTSKTVMSHLDRTTFQYENLLDLVKTFDVYLEFDLFGVECSYYQLNENVDMPSDAQRINTIINLIKDGYINRILLSHDIHTKHRLASFGGHGFSHVFKNIVPRLKKKGLSDAQIETLLVKNPAEWLTFGKPSC